MSIDQPDLFDALRRVEEHADDDWKAAAAVALEQLAATGREFTSDDVRDAIPAHITTHEMRALGPVMKAGIRDGLVTATGWTTQGRAAAHGRPRRLYRGRAQ